MWTVVALIALGYLLGSIPTGYWLGKILKGIDIREHGSHSTGATNVLRCLGKGPALFVLFFDAAKGYFPVWLAVCYENSVLPLADVWGVYHLAAPFTALAAMVGHSKSIFLGFQGGKSAATALGTLLALNTAVGSLVFGLWITLVFTTRYVSIASIVTGFSSIVFMALLHNPVSYVVYCLSGALLVLYRHKSNISRLFAGKEPRLGEKNEQEAQSKDSIATSHEIKS